MKELFYKLFVLVLTYLTYLAYHIAKRPIAVVENSKYFLDCDTDTDRLNDDEEEAECKWSWVTEMKGVSKDEADSIIGNMQTFYAAFYAAFMFVAGWIAER